MRSGSASRVCPANTTFHGPLFRGCSYSFMFRPPSLLASRVVPTATGSPAGQLSLLHPSRTCIVAFARIGYAIRPTTGNWRSEDFHLARFTALSTACDLKAVGIDCLKGGSIRPSVPPDVAYEVGAGR